jgi:hypothetical protein
MRNELPTTAIAVVVLSALVTAVVSTWCTVVAFVGGTMPIVGWHTEGSVGLGLLWVLVVDPIVMIASWLLTAFVAVSVTTMFRRLDWTDEHDRRWME